MIARALWLSSLMACSLAGAAPAKRYGESVRAFDKRAPVCARVEALAVSLERQLVSDPRLAAAAEDILARLPPGGRPANELVEAALWLHGLVEPAPHLIVATMTPDGTEPLLEQLQTDLPHALGQGRFVRVGVAARPSGAEIRILVALQESHLELRPLPRALPAGGSAPLEAHLLDNYRRPAAYVTLPDGSVDHLVIARSDDSHLRTTVRCGAQPGRHQVEITGEERFGPAVVANFPLWCGMPAPTTLPTATGNLATQRTREEAEAEMLRLVNRDRARARLAPVTLDPALVRVARAHSADMHAHDFVGHVSPTTGSPNDRLRAAGLSSQLVLENVARAASAGEAEEGLMGSPGHRSNLLNPTVTQIGIGIELGTSADGANVHEQWVTQLFVRPVDHVDGRTGPAVLSDLATLRREKGLVALLGDNELDEVAKRAAADVADGQDPARVGGTVDKVLSRLGRRFDSVKSVVAVAGSTDQLLAGVQKSALEAGLTHVGIGIQEGKRKDGSAALYGVFLLAVQR